MHRLQPYVIHAATLCDVAGLPAARVSAAQLLRSRHREHRGDTLGVGVGVVVVVAVAVVVVAVVVVAGGGGVPLSLTLTLPRLPARRSSRLAVCPLINTPYPPGGAAGVRADT